MGLFVYEYIQLGVDFLYQIARIYFKKSAKERKVFKFFVGWFLGWDIVKQKLKLLKREYIPKIIKEEQEKDLRFHTFLLSISLVNIK